MLGSWQQHFLETRSKFLGQVWSIAFAWGAQVDIGGLFQWCSGCLHWRGIRGLTEYRRQPELIILWLYRRSREGLDEQSINSPRDLNFQNSCSAQVIDIHEVWSSSLLISTLKFVVNSGGALLLLSLFLFFNWDSCVTAWLICQESLADKLKQKHTKSKTFIKNVSQNGKSTHQKINAFFQGQADWHWDWMSDP